MTTKNIHKIFIPPKNIHFSEIPKNIEIQNFEPKKIARAYVCVEISEYPPPPWGCTFHIKTVFRSFVLANSVDPVYMMRNFIWVITVWQTTHLGITSIQMARPICIFCSRIHAPNLLRYSLIKSNSSTQKRKCMRIRSNRLFVLGTLIVCTKLVHQNDIGELSLAIFASS